MALWYLQVLGAPQLTALTPSSKSEVHFRYRDTWLLLASLVLEPQVNVRGNLIERLSLDDQQTGREKLRMRLHDLRHGAPARKESLQCYCGLGPEHVRTEGEHIVLAPDVVRTDLQELDALLRGAAELPLRERLASLKQGIPLLRGPFLSGFESMGEGGSWLEAHRFQVDRLVMEFWLQLAKALDATGERRSAFDAARRAYCLAPETPETLELLLNLAEGVREREEVLLLTKQLGLEDLAGRLEELEKEGQSPTISEEQALQEALKARLSQLSQRAGAALKAIALFPQDFTAHQATAITNTDAETLERLVRVFPIQKRGERYSLMSALRNALQRFSSPGDQALFHQRHAHFFTELIVPGPRPDEDEKRQQFLGEEQHLLAALKWVQTLPPTPEGLLLLQNSWLWLNDSPPIRQALIEAIPYLEAAVRRFSDISGQMSVELLGTLSMAQSNYKRALDWFQLNQERFRPQHQHNWLWLLQAAHHSAEDAVFDHYANLLLTQWPIGNLSILPPDQQRLTKEAIYSVIAENRMARRHFAEAREHNTTALTLRLEAGLGEDSSPALWGQRAAILRGLGCTIEAEACWDRALRAFEQQGNRGGMAECYRELGELLAESGRVGLGISLVQQAIPIFEEVGNLGAVAATRGTLGDILLAQGQVAEAQALYEEGLRYWKAQKHPRWTAKFEARLARCALGHTVS